MSLKPMTRYRCPNPECPHLGPYTGHAFGDTTRTTREMPDECEGCGTLLVEETDDGERYKLSWEMITSASHPELYDGDKVRPTQLFNDRLPDRYWSKTAKEHTSVLSAREQWDGLHTLVEQGELIRNIKIEKATVVWQEVDW